MKTEPPRLPRLPMRKNKGKAEREKIQNGGLHQVTLDLRANLTEGLQSPADPETTLLSSSSGTPAPSRPPLPGPSSSLQFILALETFLADTYRLR